MTSYDEQDLREAARALTRLAIRRGMKDDIRRACRDLGVGLPREVAAADLPCFIAALAPCADRGDGRA